MTRDQHRIDKAARCDRNSLQEVGEALAALQSTEVDDPYVYKLHNELLAQYRKLEASQKGERHT